MLWDLILESFCSCSIFLPSCPYRERISLMEDYPDFGPSIVGVSLSLVVVAAILVIIRTFYRIKSHAFGADDALIIAAVTFSISHSVVDVICTFLILTFKGVIVLISKYSCLSMGLWQAQREPNSSPSYSSRTITGKDRMVIILLTKLTVYPRDSGWLNSFISWWYRSRNSRFVSCIGVFSSELAGASR